MGKADAFNVKTRRTLDRVRPFEVDCMEEVILSLIRTNNIAAEVAFELNPTEKIEEWWDISAYSGTIKTHSNSDKPQKQAICY